MLLDGTLRASDFYRHGLNAVAAAAADDSGEWLRDAAQIDRAAAQVVFAGRQARGEHGPMRDGVAQRPGVRFAGLRIEFLRRGDAIVQFRWQTPILGRRQ